MKPLLQSRAASKSALQQVTDSINKLSLPKVRSMTPEFLDSEAASPPEEKKAEKGPSPRAETQEEGGAGKESEEKKRKEEERKPSPESAEGIKFDIGKLRWDLIPYEALTEVVRVVTFGATKYGPNNWRHLTCPDGRYFAAAMRHMVAWQTGERTDPETGLSHLAHAACNLLFLMWFDRDRK